MTNTTPEVKQILRAMAMEFGHLDEADWDSIIRYIEKILTVLTLKPTPEEDAFENFIYQLYTQYFSLEEKGLVPNNTHCVTDNINFEEIVQKHKDILTALTAKHEADIEKAVEAEKKRILDELWRLVEWHSEEKNQMFGLVSANTTINALHQARGIVRGDNYAATSQPAPTKTDKQ